MRKLFNSLLRTAEILASTLRTTVDRLRLPENNKRWKSFRHAFKTYWSKEKIEVSYESFDHSGKSSLCICSCERGEYE